MRIAIVHDGFLHVGGAEKVLLEIVALYPEADLFIPIINQNLKKMLEEKVKGKIQTSFFSYFPFFYQRASWLKPFLIFYWENLNLSRYQFVISSSHSFNSKLINVPKDTPHLSYVYTPPRYLSQHFNEMTMLKNGPTSKLLSPLMSWLRKKDQESGKKPSLLVAISKTVQDRIAKTYHRKSVVIYPPVLTKLTQKEPSKPMHYLCFSRLVKQKGIDLAVKTCTKLKLPLVVVGTGPELNNLKNIAGPSVKFLNYANDQELAKVFSHTKAMINCAHEEDFGMVTVEAAANGIPLIAYRSGGLMETVIENKTGIFFNQHTVESLSQAIKRFEQIKIKPDDCREFAQHFSQSIFRKKFALTVDYLLKND